MNAYISTYMYTRLLIISIAFLFRYQGKVDQCTERNFKNKNKK